MAKIREEKGIEERRGGVFGEEEKKGEHYYCAVQS